MGQSKTITSRMGQEVPSWARYSVQICHSVIDPDRPEVLNEPEQLFSCRIDAERFAFACSAYFKPAPATGETSMSLQFALVNALAATGAARGSIGLRHCYLSIDAGGVVIKRHPIMRGFYGAKCVSCAQPTEAI